MSLRKSPVYTVLAILFSLIVLAGGAAKLYRGISRLSSSGLDPQVGELLKKSDTAVDEANRQAGAAAIAFQELLGDFDRLGVVEFRQQKQETCAQIREQFEGVSTRLQEASTYLIEATQHGTNEKTTAFLKARAQSYELLMKVGSQNIEIIRTILDESMVDPNAIVQKVMSIAESRDANQKAATEATVAANAILNRS